MRYKEEKWVDGVKLIKLNDDVWIGLAGTFIENEKEMVNLYIKKSKTEDINKEFIT